MRLLIKIKDLLSSLKTAFALFSLMTAVLVLGSLMLPYNLAFFSGIDDTALFLWLKREGRLALSWWIYAMIALLSLMAVNTIVCSFETLVEKLSARRFLSVISPQIAHIGVLVVMLGHLLTASMGAKNDFYVEVGGNVPLSCSAYVTVQSIDIVEDEYGFPADWSVRVQKYLDGKPTEAAVIGPARPMFFNGCTVFSKSVDKEDGKLYAAIKTNRDPGALWALIGGVLMAAGFVMTVFVRYKKTQH